MDLIAICIHGAGGGAWEYDLWKDSMTESSIRLIAVHLIPKDGDDYETTHFEDYVQQIIEMSMQFDRKKSKLFLVGASMGGTLIAKAAETIKPSGMIFVCTTIPKLIPGALHPVGGDNESYPPRVCWARKPGQETVDAIPDATLDIAAWAAANWRDESGCVLNSIAAGVDCDIDLLKTIKICVVVPMEDDSISPDKQLQFAHEVSARDVFQYPGMSHAGPLLSNSARQVALDVANWIKKSSSDE